MKVHKRLTAVGTVMMAISLLAAPVSGVAMAEGAIEESAAVVQEEDQSLESTKSFSAPMTFKDVKSSHWAYNAIQSAVQKGYFKGYNDGTFRPNAAVTKEELATLLSRVSDNEESASGSVPNDVRGRWSESAIQTAINMGFINSGQYNAGLKPQQAISRLEMTKWFVNGLAHKNPDYKNAMEDTRDTIVPVAEFHKGQLNKADHGVISVALGTGLVTGFSNGSFGGDKTTTRAEVAVMLLRYAEIQNKDPKEFNQLEQLREVGLTGANVESMGLEYAKNGFGKVITFPDIRGDGFPLKNRKGNAKLYNLIVVDIKNAEALYTKMFLGKENTLSRIIDGNNEYLVMTYRGLTPNVEMEMSDYVIAWDQSALAAPGFETGNEKSWSIPSLPMRQSWIQTKFFEVGKEKKYWGMGRMTRIYNPDLRKVPLSIDRIPLGEMVIRIPEVK